MNFIRNKTVAFLFGLLVLPVLSFGLLIMYGEKFASENPLSLLVGFAIVLLGSFIATRFFIAEDTKKYYWYGVLSALAIIILYALWGIKQPAKERSNSENYLKVKQP